MFESNAKKLTLKCVVLVLLILGLILFSRDSTRALLAPSQIPANGVQLPTVTQADQEGTPLRIVETLVETPDPEKTVVRVVVQNQSAKNIRAFTVTADTRIEFINLSGKASILSPTQNRVFDITYMGDERPKTVNLSVDFVEFGDGATWGPDMNKSHDRLSGQRAGAKMERRRLRELLKAKGAAAVLTSVSEEPSGDNSPSSTSGRSSEWQEGFRSGVGSARHRIRQALQTGDSTQLEQEVARPFDTSEGEPQ
ncbi:MAG: hypothetical protein H0T60_07075 [Acidobacteria bacterium]|nr:hypothetical protein [Acidobacteriota bacterium]